jgi:hypothetical protein
MYKEPVFYENYTVLMVQLSTPYLHFIDFVWRYIEGLLLIKWPIITQRWEILLFLQAQ